MSLGLLADSTVVLYMQRLYRGEHMVQTWIDIKGDDGILSKFRSMSSSVSGATLYTYKYSGPTPC